MYVQCILQAYVWKTNRITETDVIFLKQLKKKQKIHFSLLC